MNRKSSSRTFLLLLALLSLLPGAAFSETASKQRETEHFLFYYDPQKLTEVQIDAAVREADDAFQWVSRQFPMVTYSNRIVLRLDARFRGATGYAAPGGVTGKGKRDVIGLRYEELDSLGLTPRFLFRHELTHLFSARWRDGTPDRSVAASPLGEGLADLVADGRNGMGLPLSFAKYLRDHGGWTSPMDLFLHPREGAPPRPVRGSLSYDQVFTWRIERYVEPSLLLAYLRSRIGWEKLRDFYIDYAQAAQNHNPADQIRTVIRRYTGELPEEFFAEWDRAMTQAPDEPEENRQRWLSERSYSAVQWYEFHVGGKVIPASAQQEIESQFRQLHAEVAAKHLDAAETRLRTLRQTIQDSISAPRRAPDSGG